jgi:hypothetical protein
MKNEKQIKKIKLSIVALENAIKVLEEDKPEFEVGKWYKHGKHSLFCFVKENMLGFNGYGFNPDGWCDDNTWARNWEITPATNEEVEAALIKEAKKRGFKEGVEAKGLNHFKMINGYDFHWFIDYNVLHFQNQLIYKEGQWASIIEEPKVVINGYEMKQEGDIITFGCAKFDKYWLERLLEACEKNEKKLLNKQTSNNHNFR